MAIKDTLEHLEKTYDFSCSQLTSVEKQIAEFSKRRERWESESRKKKERIECLRILKEAFSRTYSDLDPRIGAFPKPMDLQLPRFEDAFRGLGEYLRYFSLSPDAVFPDTAVQKFVVIGHYTEDGYVYAPGHFFLEEYAECVNERCTPEDVLHFLLHYASGSESLRWEMFSSRLFQAVVRYGECDHLVEIDGRNVQPQGYRPVIKTKKIWKDTCIAPSFFFKKV